MKRFVLPDAGWRDSRLEDPKRHHNDVLVRCEDAGIIDASDDISNCCRRSCECGEEPQGVQRARPVLSRCPLCFFARKRFDDTVIPYVAKLIAQNGSAFLVTIVCARDDIGVENLRDFEPKRLLDWARRRLSKISLASRRATVAVCGIDFQVVETRGRRLISPHLHMVVTGPSKNELRHALMPRQSGSRRVYQPLQIKRAENQGAIRYALKFGLDGPNRNEPFRRNNSSGNLKPGKLRCRKKELLAYEEFLLKRSFGDLMFLFGGNWTSAQTRCSGTRVRRQPT